MSIWISVAYSRGSLGDLQTHVRRRFTHLEALNGVQSIACFLWAAVLLALPFQRSQKGAKIAPWLAYWKPGVSNSIGPALGTQALKNISYPAQVSD